MVTEALAMHGALVCHWVVAVVLLHSTPVEAQKTLVRFGYFSESMPLGVACARRWLDTEDYEVGCFPQSSGSYAVSRLDQGDLDVSLLGSTPAAISNSRGVRATTFQMAHGHGKSQGLAVRDSRATHGPLEMLGKCLASPFGSTAHYHLLFLIHMLDLSICPSSATCDEVDPACVTVVNMSPSGLMAAWDAEEIDGAYIWGTGFLHLKATGGTVIIDSADLKSWGKETFIIVAAREGFAEDFPGLLEHIARVKLSLDDSWLAADAAWDPSREGNETFLASMSHFLSRRTPREVEAGRRLEIHHDMETKEFFSTQTQLGCQYLGHPSACPRADTHSVSGLAETIRSTSKFFMEQKGLATAVPWGKYYTDSSWVHPASYFDAMIDSSVLFTAKGLHSVTLDTLITTTNNVAIPSASSVEIGSCDSGGNLWSPTGNALTGSFTDKVGVSYQTLGASYENNMHCMFRIPPPANLLPVGLVEVIFVSFRVWSGDIVRLYEGDAVDDLRPTGKLLAQFQGIDPVIPPIRSAGPIVVEFVTDKNTEECYNMPQGDGWEISFDRSHPGCLEDGDCNRGTCIQESIVGHLRSLCACEPGWAGADCSFPGCLGTVIARTPTGTFRSSAYSLQSADYLYENSAACVFEVHTEENTVSFSIEMDLESTFDWLEVRAGTGVGAVVYSRLTGYRTLTVTVPTLEGIASLHFTTDDKGRRSGFAAHYTTGSRPCSQQCSPSHGTCEGRTCVCAPGWAGIDCTLPFCAPGPLRYPGQVSGVIQSNADTVFIPAMIDCHFETEILSSGLVASRGKHVGTRLLVQKFDLEPDSVGDLVIVRYASTALTLRSLACTTSADCSQSWQSGQCVDQICTLRKSIDVLTTVPLQVHIHSDRNDITAPNRRGVSMTWNAIAACPVDGRTTWECVGPAGSCDCEVNDGTCSADGACECPSGHCACGCGGHVAHPPYWILGIFVGILLCVGAAGYLKRKHSKEKNQRRRDEAKKDAADTMAKALVAQAKTLELEKKHMSYPVGWELDPQNTVTIDDDTVPGGKRTVQLPIDGLLRVPETSPEYWDVYDQLTRPPDPTVVKEGHKSDTRGMWDAWITQLHRIQNPDLYMYFMNQKERLKNSNGPRGDGRQRPESMKAFDGKPTEGNPLGQLREVMGWHGTNTFPAENIYTDRQDGFMMQFASQGQWGRGLYFAEEAGYSAWYATNASSLQPDVRDSKGMKMDESEFLLATLLIGNTVEMDRDRDEAMRQACHELKTAPAVAGCQVVPAANDGLDACTIPPVAGPPGGLKYNTVRGFTQTDKKLPDQSWIKNPECPRSRVWIVYENGRAYPRYLVRYYRGSFDPARVKYRTRVEAGAVATSDEIGIHTSFHVAGAADTGPKRKPPSLTSSGPKRKPPSLPQLSTPPPRAPSRPVDYQWKCEVDDGTVDYPPPVNYTLEEAFNRRWTQTPTATTVEFVGFRGMAYIGDVVAGVQTNCSTGVQRRMVRYVNGLESSWVTRVDASTGRYFYEDNLNPDQPSTWSRNPGCPSEPFAGGVRPSVRPSDQIATGQVQWQANPVHATRSRQPGRTLDL